MEISTFSGKVNVNGLWATATYDGATLTIIGVRLADAWALVEHIEKFGAKVAPPATHVFDVALPAQPKVASVKVAAPSTNGTANGHANSDDAKVTQLNATAKLNEQALRRNVVDDVEAEVEEKAEAAAATVEKPATSPKKAEPFVDDYDHVKLIDLARDLAKEDKPAPEELSKARILKDVVGYFSKRGVAGQDDMVGVCIAWKPLVPVLSRIAKDDLERRVRSLMQHLAQAE